VTRLFILVLAALGPGVAANAALYDVPPQRPYFHYYGPITYCGPLFAIDVRRGEAFSDHSTSSMLQFPGGSILVNHALYPPTASESVTLPGGPPLQRVLHPPEEGRREVSYIYADPRRARFSLYRIASDLFDGTDRDFALLGRLRFGAAGRAHCARIPAARQAKPSRADPDAATYDPRQYPGPLTICLDGFAFDVRRGERVVLPWHRGWRRFRLLRRSGHAEVDAYEWGAGSLAAVSSPVATAPVSSSSRGRAWSSAKSAGARAAGRRRSCSFARIRTRTGSACWTAKSASPLLAG
jgi:hypothetical protein